MDLRHSPHQLFVFMSIIPSVALADFEWETKVQVDNDDRDFGNPATTSLTRYFEDVSYDSDLPYAETAFGKRVGDVSFSYKLVNTGLTDVSTSPGRIRSGEPTKTYIWRTENSNSSDGFGVGINLRFPDNNNFGAVRLSREESKGAGKFSLNDKLFTQSSFNAKSDEVYAEYGYYLNDTWTVSLGAEYVDSKQSTTTDMPFGDQIWRGDYFIEESSLSLSSRKLINIAVDQWITAFGSLSYTDESQKRRNLEEENKQYDFDRDRSWVTYKAGIIYYPYPRSSVEASYAYEQQSGNYLDRYIAGIRLTHYFNDSIYADLETQRAYTESYPATEFVNHGDGTVELIEVGRERYTQDAVSLRVGYRF